MSTSTRHDDSSTAQIAGADAGGFPGWEQTILRAFLCATVVFAIDLAFVYFSYARPFLHTASSHVQMVIQAGVFVALATAIITLFVRFGYAAAHFFGRYRYLSNSQSAVWVVALFQLTVGAAIVVRGTHEVFSGTSALLMAAFAVGAALILGGGRIVRSLTRREELANVLFVAGLGLAGWFVFQFASLFVFQGFGVDSTTGLLRIVFVFGAPLGLFFLFAFRAAEPERHLSGTALGVFCIGLVGALVVLQYLNATQYVDNYLALHFLLSLTSYVLAWTLVGPFVTGRLEGASPIGPRSATAVGLVLLVAAVAVFAKLPVTVGGYVGAVHTVHQRLAINTVSTLQNAPASAKWTALGLKSRLEWLWDDAEDEIEESGSLPSTFRPLETTDQRPEFSADNVVVFFLDMKRPEDFGMYGTEDAETPATDACFSDGFWFERAYSPASSTTVGFSAKYTGTYSATRGLLRWDGVLPYWFEYQDGYNLPDVFGAHGFQTNLWTDKWYWDELFDEGNFSTEYEATFGTFDNNFVVPDHDDTVEARGLRELFDEQRDSFLSETPSLEVFHIFSHPIEELGGVDAFIGEVCEEIRQRGEFDNTALVLTADHGYQQREHGRTDYGLTTFDSEIRVPLLVRVPGLEGRSIEQPVSGVDHLPTLLDIIEIGEEFQTEGRSYLPEMLGASPGEPRTIFSETRRFYHSTAVIQGRYKLIYWAFPGVYALFDVVDDPEERYNLVDDPEHREAFERLRGELMEFLRERGEQNWRP